MASTQHVPTKSNMQNKLGLLHHRSKFSTEKDDPESHTSMLTKLAHLGSDRIVHAHETLALDANLKGNGNGENESKLSHQPGGGHHKLRPTSTETPTKYLRVLRSSSIVSRETSMSSIDDSTSSNSSDSDIISRNTGREDSIRCNDANMPNKITGEMGLQITIDPEVGDKLILKFHPDRHFQYIHPHVFGPACLSDVHRMGGGGSGIAVFCGTHPDLGEIVMKHGDFNDMKELFALTKISSELQKRGRLPNNDASKAAAFMVNCLPEFKMVYISPQHLLLKEKAIWGKLRKLVRVGNLLSRVYDTLPTKTYEKNKKGSSTLANLVSKMHMHHHDPNKSDHSSHLKMSLDDSAFLGPGSSIRIYECDSGKAKAFLDHHKQKMKQTALALVVPKDHVRSVDATTMEIDFSESFDSLGQIYDSISPMMSKHLFKFTLAQKRIGGHNATTGSQWLYDRKLDGLVLANLISSFVKTVRNLQTLTLSEEIDVIDEVRNEIQRLKASDEHCDVLSTLTDQFMGNAIKKNFHPSKGRIRYLRKTCRDFLENELHLEPEEELPAKHLGILAEPESVMSDVFVGASTEPPMLHPDKDFWINLMSQAASDRKCMSPNATKRIWTSGLCDAGIHNLFVSNDHLYFFDLGVPQLQSLPGFMTKFLFSFFHVLGMQEDKENNNEWVHRFVQEGDKLALTQQTKDLLPMAYDAFEVSLNRIIEEIFDGDQSLRWLLLQYVTLQLLSDASFCLQRWKMKGGGQPRGENHNQGLERWLWRALWDTYVAFDINSKESWKRLQVEHHSCEEANCSIQEGLRSSIALDPNARYEYVESIDEKEEGEETKNAQGDDERHSLDSNLPPPRTKISGQRDSGNRRRSLRWSSERLNESSLRALTAAAFEYNYDDAASEHSDDDSDDDSDIIGSSFSTPSEKTEISLSSLPEEDEEQANDDGLN